MRICFIGDSFVNGVGDDTCLGWTGRLCAEARRAGWDITHYNLGIRRDTSLDIHERWRREAEARLPAGLDGRLVFAFGANDCTFMDGRTCVPHDRCLDTVRAILADAAGWRKTLMMARFPSATIPRRMREFWLCQMTWLPSPPVSAFRSFRSSTWPGDPMHGPGRPRRGTEPTPMPAATRPWPASLPSGRLGAPGSEAPA